MYKMKLYESFDQYCFWMCNKYNKTLIEALKQDRVYIVKYIAKSLNKFALISAVHTLHSETAFSAAASDVSLHNNMTDFLEVDTALLNKKIKAYRL